jgi:hypothetical protein
VTAVGDEVELFCPIPCDEDEDGIPRLTKGVVQGGLAFLVLFPGGRLEVVALPEITPH